MKMIELLLTENVDNLGIVGDVVNVKPGYARNYLMPRGLAAAPTKGNITRLSEVRKKVENQMMEHRKTLEATLEKLNGHEITMMRSANEQGVLFGGVSQHDISEALKAEGFDVDDRAVRIGDQIKQLDSYMIPIALAADLQIEIKLWVVSDKPVEDLDVDSSGEPGDTVATASDGAPDEAGDVTSS